MSGNVCQLGLVRLLLSPTSALSWLKCPIDAGFVFFQSLCSTWCQVLIGFMTWDGILRIR